MGKAYPPDEFATRIFLITMAGTALFVAAVFLFVI